MGTNYYRIKKISPEVRKEINMYLDKNDLSSLRSYLNEIIEENKVHICKTSWGWQTLFDHNWGKYYKPTRQSLEQFLKEPDTYVVDEYGEKITFEEFWDMVDTRNAHPNNKYTSELYRKENPSAVCCNYEDNRKCYEMFGIFTTESDFKNTGLRWAVFSDFS